MTDTFEVQPGQVEVEYIDIVRRDRGLLVFESGTRQKYATFAEDEAESLYGREAVQSGYFDVDKFADALYADYQSAWLDDTEFWYRA